MTNAATAELDPEGIWIETCNEHNWDDATQVIHLEAFLRDRGLFAEFAAYAATVANAEESEARAAALCAIGFGFWSGDKGHYWTGPDKLSEGSERVEQATYETSIEANDAAWASAVAFTKRVMKLSEQAWDALDSMQQAQAIEAAFGV